MSQKNPKYISGPLEQMVKKMITLPLAGLMQGTIISFIVIQSTFRSAPCKNKVEGIMYAILQAQVGGGAA